jgi:hypothetical protein
MRHAAVIACAVLIGLAGWIPSQAAQPATTAPESSAADRLAEKYYDAVNDFLLAEKAESDRDTKAIWDKTIPVPATATGTVRSRFGGPVAEAEVAITPEEGEGVLGTGKTDAQGKFKINLSRDNYRGLAIEVKAKGFVRFGQSGLYGGLVGFMVVLDREIDDDRLAAVAAEKDPERRLEGVLELVAAREMSDLGIDKVFPYIGKLRDDLKTIIATRAFGRKDDRRESPADRALRLLAFWGDPADEALVAPWLKDNVHVAPPPQPIAGATIEEACRRYADAHFGNKPADQRTLSVFGKPLYSLEKDRALIVFNVEYAYWGYSKYLVLVKEGDSWRLKVVADHRHWEKRPPMPPPGN